MSRWQDFLSMLSERRVGFRVDETMRGTHRFVDEFVPAGIAPGAELPFEFQASWGNPKLLQFLNPLHDEFLFSVLEGTVTAGGICTDAPMKGTLALRYFQEAAVRYTFDFTSDGRVYRYTGEKSGIRPWNLLKSHTTCYGSVVDVAAGAVVSDSVVYFDPGQLFGFVRSLRFS